MTDGIKYLDLTEFRELGFLQEVNRQFFHPLGLALEVHGQMYCSQCDRPIEPDGEGWVHIELTSDKKKGMPYKADHEAQEGVYSVDSIAGVWDYRNDPEGIVFDWAEVPDAKAKAVSVNAELKRHRPGREALFDGEVIQPLP